MAVLNDTAKTVRTFVYNVSRYGYACRPASTGRYSLAEMVCACKYDRPNQGQDAGSAKGGVQDLTRTGEFDSYRQHYHSRLTHCHMAARQTLLLQDDLLHNASLLDEIDLCLGFAQVADELRFVRPEMDTGCVSQFLSLFYELL